MTERFAHVALPLPLAAPYTYRIPEALGDRVLPGARVVVPVRPRELIGIVLEIDDAAPAEPRRGTCWPRPIPSPRCPGACSRPPGGSRATTARRSASPSSAVLPAGMWGASQVIATLVDDGRREPGGLAGEVLAWLEQRGGEATVADGGARAQAAGLGRRGSAGAGRRGGAPGRAAGHRCGARATERVAGPGRRAADAARTRRAVPRARRSSARLYEALERSAARAGAARARTARLQRRGAAGAGEARAGAVAAGRAACAIRSPTRPRRRLRRAHAGPGGGARGDRSAGPGRRRAALRRHRQRQDAGLPRGHPRGRSRAGRGAIVLVPEIGLTPQTVSRLRGAFGDQVAVLHSGLSDGERADAWRLLRRGERRVAVGARSADLRAGAATSGIIVVDEEHEASYKNGEAPRYHAARRGRRPRPDRGRRPACSAAPRRRSRRGRRPSAAAAAPAARAGRRAAAAAGRADRSPHRAQGERAPARSPGRRRSTRRSSATLARREQALLLLNRRGCAAFLQCPDCGEVWQCPRCSISLTVHQRRRRSAATTAATRSRCRSPAASAPTRCSRCAGSAPSSSSGCWPSAFPAARLARMDLDTTSTKWSHQRILAAVEAGEVDLLLGTQMIAKGLDFPNVTLVGVVDADTGLYLPGLPLGRADVPAAGPGGRPGRPGTQGRAGAGADPAPHAPCAGARRAARYRGVPARGAEPAASRRRTRRTTSLVNLVVSGPDERRRWRRARSWPTGARRW